MILVNECNINEEYFPDGTLKMLDMPETVPFPQDIIVWKFENITEQILLYNIVNHLRNNGSSNIALVMPYIPNARMDRVKAETECFTLKYFAKFINDLNFSLVVVLDPHSDVSAALIDRIQILNPATYIREIIKENNFDIICFPDNGACKRYLNDIIKEFNIPAICYDKQRDWKTGIITSLKVNLPSPDFIKDKKVLIIDDICSRGGTFILCANALKENGAADVGLWVSHCENSIFAGKILSNDSPISNVWTTDSLAKAEHDKIHVFKFDVESI